MGQKSFKYAGFWIRAWASLIDTLLQTLIFFPIISIYGITGLNGHATKANQNVFLEILLTTILPIAIVIIFWIYKSATPGKMIAGLKIINAKTGQKPSTLQFIGRYLAYFVSALPFLLGFFWIAFDKNKQGWHDKLSITAVIITKHSTEQPNIS